jgi:hypothetical protein
MSYLLLDALLFSPRLTSVRITSKKTYNQGLFVFDILRMVFLTQYICGVDPHLRKKAYGCSVWPAAWLVGPSWPTGGEIDVIEGTGITYG